jgi:RNA polymerase sigma-70 factor (TIGR02960 family)
MSSRLSARLIWADQTTSEVPTVAEPDTDLDFTERAERYRRELHVHCYRMLGSFDEAEDAVQEVMLQAWRRRGDLERPEHLRAWLYKIATNRCLDHLRSNQRRVATLSSFRDIAWLEPYPDRLLAEAAPAEAEPDASVVASEKIGLAFLAVLQLLPARQRAALVLRDVLDWPAAEVAELLDLSVAAVNSALQRARATLRTALPVDERERWEHDRGDAVEADVLARYIAAYESGDAEATLALLAEDIRVTMPPAPYLFEGRDSVLGLAIRAREVGRWRLVPTRANGQPAAACYLQTGGEAEFRAYKIDVLDLAGNGTIRAITTFGVRHFEAFGLPAVLP